MATAWDFSTSIHEAISMQVCFPVLFTLLRRHISCNKDMTVGRSIAHWPAETWDHYKASLCGICAGRNGAWTGFSPSS